MTLVIPTTAELRDNIVASIEASIAQTVPLLPKSFIRVLSTVLAAVLVVLYKYSSFIFLQIFVAFATLDTTTINGIPVQPLLEWGRLIGVGDRTPATAAELTIELAVTGSGTLPAGTQFQHAASGVVYVTIAATILGTPTTATNVRASSDPAGNSGLGEIGNRQIGDIVSAVNPIAGVNSDAPVTIIVTTGADAETSASYRQRVIDRFQFRPQGGAYADYQQWSVEVDGIINAYPFTSDLPGEVDVFVESGTEVDGIPTAAQLTAVAESIQFDENGLASRRPANAFVNTLPITRRAFDVEVFGLDVDDAAQIQIDIQAGLTQYFLQRENFILGLNLPPRKDRITDIEVSGVISNIVTAAGGLFDSATLETNAAVVTQYSLVEGEKAKLGTLVFTP